jgi:hypothetical protein
MTNDRRPIQIPQQPDDEVIAFLRGKTPEELNAIEAHELCPGCNGAKVQPGTSDPCAVCSGTGRSAIPRMFFPEALRRRDARGRIVEEPVYLTIPTEPDMLRAQRETVTYIAREYGAPDVKTITAAREIVGALRFQAIENAALVSLCARNMQPPHIRAYLLNVLLATYSPSTIADVYTRLDTLHRLWDVRVSYLTEEQFRAMCAELARVKNASPFVALDHALHGPFVTSLAERLTAFQTCSSCSGCKHRSTAE